MLQHRRRLVPLSAAAARTLLTLPIIEPPLDSKILEKPCTVILMQDPDGLYPTSWHDQLSTKLPTEHGISYTSFSLSRPKKDNDSSLKLFQQGLQEMKQELSAENVGTTGGILVARGPWMSWMAQFHLESLSLAGLILVDPLPLDDRSCSNQLDMLYRKHELCNSVEYELYQDYVAQHWAVENSPECNLQLEPGSVPMLVLQSMHRPAFDKAAVVTAQRHENLEGPFGEVLHYKLDAKRDDPKDENVPAILASWINHHVL
jgi:hypothetical protein